MSNKLVARLLFL